MPRADGTLAADRSQRRASYQRARSVETKRALVQAAMALWRTNGYANTTVADICRAAGVSKALFYFYFPRKEDVLFEVGVLSTKSAQRTVHDMLAEPYEIPAVVDAALTTLARSMSRNPRELIIETILEGYRHEHRILAGEQPADPGLGMFSELFEKAQQDGKLPADVDVHRLAHIAGMLVSEGARHWAAGAFGDRSFTEIVGADIAAVVAGYCK
jgi:AcrR family transcriptional regulator